jgi:hypothetical protein
MTMEITNNSPALQGINTASGEAVYLLPGETRDLDVSAAELATLKDVTFLGIAGLDRGSSYPPKENGSSPKTGLPVYSVKEKGAGWFVIVDGETEVTKSLRKDAVDGFDDKTDAEKGQFVEAHKVDG